MCILFPEGTRVPRVSLERNTVIKHEVWSVRRTLNLGFATSAVKPFGLVPGFVLLSICKTGTPTVSIFSLLKQNVCHRRLRGGRLALLGCLSPPWQPGRGCKEQFRHGSVPGSTSGAPLPFDFTGARGMVPCTSRMAFFPSVTLLGCPPLNA